MRKFAPTRLGTTLRAIRQERDLSATQLAELTGMSQAAISDIESGRIANPGAASVYALAVVLGVRMEDLMGVQRVERTTKGHTRRANAEPVAGHPFYTGGE